MTADELSSAVRALVRRRAGESGLAPSFDPRLWRDLGQMGVLGLAAGEASGTAADLCRCVLELGAAGTVAPIVETVIAGQLDLGSQLAAVLGGERLATVTWSVDLVPWGELAELVVYVRDEMAFLATVVDTQPVTTLGGELWTRGVVSAGESLGPATAGLALAELAVASYVTGAGLRIIELSAGYAAERRQFGRAIGDYQAVSQPLAESYARLAGLRDLLSGEAFAELDLDRPEAAERTSRIRLVASQAAGRASYVGFQTQGGMGFVDGTELAHLGKRIRQVSLAGVPWRDSVSRAAGRLAA